MKLTTKQIATVGITLILLFFIASFTIGNIVVNKSEKEFNTFEQTGEAEATKYSLQEIDAKTGLVRWTLIAKEGATKDNLDSALIKTIKAKVYKEKEVIFELKAPYGKANSSKKEVLLYGGVDTRNNSGTFMLHSQEVALGMGTSIKAQKGFHITMRNKGTLIGDSAIINDNQSEINIISLKEAKLKDITLQGKEVYITRDDNGDIVQASVKNGGKVILKKHKNDSLIANNIHWTKNGTITAENNVTYKSKDITFESNFLLLNPDGTITAKDQVQITHGTTQCFGELLTFENKSFVVIEGRPKAIQDGKQITADKIVYNLNTEKVEAIGNVQTTLTSESNV